MMQPDSAGQWWIAAVASGGSAAGRKDAKIQLLSHSNAETVAWLMDLNWGKHFLV
jgi:hypothetical protein